MHVMQYIPEVESDDETSAYPTAMLAFPLYPMGAAYAVKMTIAVVAIQVIVRIKSGVKIENVLLKITFHIVLNVIKNVEKDYCQRLNLMDLRFSLKDMVLKNY